MRTTTSYYQRLLIRTTDYGLCERLDRLLEHLDAGFHVGHRIVGMGFVLDADMAFELHVSKSLQDCGHIQHSPVFAEDHVGFFFVIVVLEMDAVVTRAHDANLLGRVELLIKGRYGGMEQST